MNDDQKKKIRDQIVEICAYYHSYMQAANAHKVELMRSNNKENPISVANFRQSAALMNLLKEKINEHIDNLPSILQNPKHETCGDTTTQMIQKITVVN